MRVYILRHGEAEPCETTDIDRNLTTKGLQDIQKIAAYLKDLSVNFEDMYVSPYQRTQQTFSCLSDTMALSTSPDLTDALTPESQPSQILDLLQNLDAGSVLLVSHQPLVSSLVAYLADNDISQRYDYPMMPGSLAIIDLMEVAAGCGAVNALIHPEQLT